MSFQDEDSAQRADVLRRLYFASILCFTFLIVELFGGYFSRSLAILSDAAHLFSDLASFAIAIIASHLASLPTTDQHTFGLKRSESLAALFSMLSLAIVSIGLAFEAIRRLYINETPVDGKLMSGVATIGVFVNVILAAVLGVENHVHLPGSDHSHDHAHDSDEHDHEIDHHHDSNANHSHHHDHERIDIKNYDHAHGNRHHDHDDISEECDDDNHSHNHDHDSVGSHDHNRNHCHDHHSDGSHRDDDHGHGHGHTHIPHLKESGGDDHHSHSRHSSDRSHFSDHEHDHHHGGKGMDCVASETTRLLSGGCHNDDGAEHIDEIPTGRVQRNVNLHAAYLHVLSDLAQSVAVLIAGIVIWFRPEWRIVDPICTLLFCALVFYSTLSVIRNSVAVLLEEVPPNINWQKMFDEIQNVKGVQNVHDLHIWSISQSIPSLSVHCTTDRDPQQVLSEIYNAVKRQGVKHATIQIQTTVGDCITCQGLGCDQARLLSSESICV
jgi:cation diffusion facilitator family transporter